MSNEKRFVEKKQLDFVIVFNTIKKIISKRECGEIDVQPIVNDALNQLELYFTKKYVGKHEYFHKTHIPKTWKDHFKHKYRARRWLRWWIKRKPIEYFAIDRITVFPDVPVPQGQGFDKGLSYLEIIPKDEES